jgi:hypothetical protein
VQGLALIGADHTHTLVVVRVTEVPAEREEGHDRPTCGRRRVTKLRRTQEDRRDEHAMIRPRACVRANFQIPRRESEHRRDLRAQSKAKQGKGSSKRTVRPFRLLSTSPASSSTAVGSPANIQFRLGFCHLYPEGRCAPSDRASIALCSL